MQYVQISAVFQVAITTVLVSWLPPTLTKREGWKSTATVWVAHLKEGELPLQAQQLCWAQEQPTWQKQGCRHHSKAVFSRSGSPLLAVTLLLLTHLEHPLPCHSETTVMQSRGTPSIYSNMVSDTKTCTGFTSPLLPILPLTAQHLEKGVDAWQWFLLV